MKKTYCAPEIKEIEIKLSEAIAVPFPANGSYRP